MAEQFIVKGIDVMTQKSRTALEMLVQESQTIEYYYNKSDSVKEGAFDRFMELIRVMVAIADPDDDDEMKYVYKTVVSFLNFFNGSCGEEKERERALGILDFLAEKGFDFTGTGYFESERSCLRDYLIKKIHDKYSLVEKMSLMGIDLNEASVGGMTPVHLIVKRDRHGSPDRTEPEEQELARLMDFFSVESMEELDRNGISAVHTAVENNHFEVLEAMIRKEVNVNITADSPAVAGTTPLHTACEHGYPKIVQILMEAGADDTMMDVNEETPAHIAVSQKIWYKEIREEERVQMLRALKHIDIPGRNGRTPLMLAQDRELYISSEVSPVLIEKGADVNRKDNDGNNAMMMNAEWHGNMDVLKAMIKAGLDINARNTEGNTVLHLLLKRNYIQQAVYLIKKGADYQIANENQETPVQIAVEEGRTELLELMDI